MSYRGTGAPLIKWIDLEGNVVKSIQLPKCKAGGREEKFVNKTDKYENIDGELIVGTPKYRFEADYSFGVIHNEAGDTTGVDGGLIDGLSSFYNNSTVVRLVPHNEINFISYDCIITELEIPKASGQVSQNELKIKFESVKYVNAIPTIDNSLGIVKPSAIFSIDLPN